MKGSSNKRKCAVCSNIFEIPVLKGNHKSSRVTCSALCHRRYVVKRSKRWTKEEEAIIEHLSVSMPPKRLYLTYCRMAAQKGLPKRTEASFRSKLRLMGIPLMPEIDWYKLDQLAQMFDTSRHLVFRLVKKGLKAEKESEHRNQPWYVSRKELKRFARQRPDLFRDFDKDGLFIVFEDEKLVDLIMQQPIVFKPNRYNPTPIKCVETGNVYASYRAAGRAVYVDPSAIHKSAKHGYRAGGYHWVALR